ncbi:hypothetical protein MKZ01_06970 [Lysinibacillus endophyticus]|uniref:hypothetical protein n=1 Tax=Ureibacillus endophyticus TaxID=1978490 RepID=UPI003135DBB7
MISKKQFIIVCIHLLIGILIAGCSFDYQNGVKDDLDIVIFKIGKADSILLNIEEKTVLIDTGEDEDGEEIIDYMKKK